MRTPLVHLWSICLVGDTSIFLEMVTRRDVYAHISRVSADYQFADCQLHLREEEVTGPLHQQLR